MPLRRIIDDSVAQVIEPGRKIEGNNEMMAAAVAGIALASFAYKHPDMTCGEVYRELQKMMTPNLMAQVRKDSADAGFKMENVLPESIARN